VTDGTDVAAEVRTFLIADVRGYTRFTHTHGDEAAARLAGRFAEVVNEEVNALGGRVVGLRGDEALCVFASTRAALRASVALQRRCADEMRADGSLPLGIGIGIDAGEAVPVADGYRGGALNLAARLCSTAKRGEVLVSGGVVHLARRTDDITYLDRGLQRFKGLDEPVQVFQVQLDLDLPDEEAAAPAREQWTPIRAACVAIAGIVVLATVVGIAAHLTGRARHQSRLGTNVVGMLDASGHILGEIPLGGTPAGVAAGAGAVWATLGDRGQVVQIDPREDVVVDTVLLGDGAVPAGIAVGGGGVWVADSGGGRVFWGNARAALAGKWIRVGQGPGPLAFGAGAAWVVNTIDATIQRIDPESFEPSRPIAVGGSPSAVAVGGGWIWVTDAASNSVVKIDPKARQIVGRLPVGNDPVAVVYGDGELWVGNAADGTVTRITPQTQHEQVIPVGRAPSGISYAGGVVWVTTASGVVRIDRSLHTSFEPTGSTPIASTQAGGRIWVAALASRSSHRGGTLRVGYATDDFEQPGFGPFDPAVAPYADHWELVSMIGDGLVTYRKAGGTAGLQVVPDLAVAMPTISDGGRTYTFQLRRGIRYSNGRPVRASDFRYAIERTLSPAALGVASQGYYQSIFFSHIVGYAACRANPKTCSLADGIRSNDSTGTITIHLTTPDPALPQKLATSFAHLVPPGSPPPDSGKPVAGTGPYMVSRVLGHGKDGIVLVRNPYFHEWSAAAQPAGYPDQIRYVRYPTQEAELTAVEKGQANVMVDQPPSERLDELATHHATLAHTVGGLETQYLSLNTAVRPFSSLKARQAVNLAVNRVALARTMGGVAAFEPTCQVLPPGMFGYAPYCPYTSGRRTTGRWTGPDLPEARRLVAQSGTRGNRVVVWGWKGSGSRVLVPPVVRTLDALGYRASAHLTPPTSEGFGEWSAAAADSRLRVSAVVTGWAADYPNPIDFLDLLLSCRSFVPGTVTNLNSAEFCDRGLDNLIHRAEATQVRDPALGARLWQAADRRAVNAAPWAPLLTSVGTDVLSARTGNYAHNPEWSVLLDQLWVH